MGKQKKDKGMTRTEGCGRNGSQSREIGSARVKKKVVRIEKK
jgi:hypothetical protein